MRSDTLPAGDGLSPERLELLALLAGNAVPLDALPADAPGHPLSDAQHRLWLADGAGGGNSLFNFPTAMRMQGGFAHDALARVFQTVVRRHLVLTASFVEWEGEPRQVYDPAIVVRVPVIDLRGLCVQRQQRQLDVLIEAEIEHVFDLAQGPLF